MNTTLSAVHFAYIAALPKAERAPLIASMTPAELRGYTAYLQRIAEDFDADYDAWLDSLPPSQPTPEDLGE